MIIAALVAGCTADDPPEVVEPSMLEMALERAQDQADPPAVPPAEPLEPDEPDEPVPATCPDGVITAAGWSGEYPGPIAHVTQPIEVRALAHPCANTETVRCSLEPGILHPWAGNPDHTFVTVRAIQRVTATKAMQLGTQHLGVGDQVQLVQEIGEGFCAYRRGDDTFQAECPALSKGRLRASPMVDRAPRQLVALGCPAGPDGRAWLVIDDAFMAHDAVEPGAFKGYGAVRPADSP